MKRIFNGFIMLSLLAVLAAGAGCKNRVVTDKASLEANRLHIGLSGELIEERRADTVRLGRMNEGEVVEQAITVTNVGDEPMVVLGVEASCGCVSMKFPKTPVRPGESAELILRFNSRGFKGDIRKMLSMSTNVADRKYTFVVLAEVKGKKEK